MAPLYALGMKEVASLHFANIREEFGDEDELRRLGESLKTRQHHPIVCLENGQVLDGDRRVRAARLVGVTELLAITTEEELTPEQVTRVQLETAIHRRDLSGYEKWQAVGAIQAEHPDWSNTQLAESVRVTPKMIKVMLSPGFCVPEAQEALRSGRIGISTCHDLSLLPLEEQPPLLAAALNGASRDDVARMGRKQRAGTVPSAKTGKLNVPLPSGFAVTIRGSESFSLEEAIAELADLLTEMRKAEKQGLDAKTFAAVCRDRAKTAAAV